MRIGYEITTDKMSLSLGKFFPLLSREMLEMRTNERGPLLMLIMALPGYTFIPHSGVCSFLLRA